MKLNYIQMKKLSILFSILILAGCKKEDETEIPKTDPQNVSVLVQPVKTNDSFASFEKEHFIVRNDQIHLNTLFLFIGGSFSTPKNYNFVCEHAASLGLDVISLSYPNDVATAPLGESSDPMIFDNYRDEICFGNQVSNVVDVNAANSINSRTIKLLQYLNIEYPTQNWSQYLSESNTLRWEKIVVAGHSQGSGHAGYLGKKNLVDRVIMFSGPNDYNTTNDEPANWLTQNGATPLNKHYSLLHVQDEIVPFTNQVNNLRGLGILTASEDPLPIDNLAPPYSNAHSLSLNINALSNHSSTIGSNSILPEIWTYMFTND